MCAQFVSFAVLLCSSFGLILGAQDEKDIAFPDDLDISKFSRQNFMMHPHHHHHPPDFYHHHHHPEFHGHEDPRKKVGDGERYDVTDEGGFDNASMQIPIDFIQSLNEYNVTDLLLHFVEGKEEDDKEVTFENRFGDDDAEGQERSAARMPKNAECLPELRSEKIAASDDPSVLYIPQCTRIERCGGCCKHELLSCQPLKKEMVPFKVHKTQYTGEKKLKYLGPELVMVEKHTQCKCMCRVKPEDCTKFQKYRENQCQCVCINIDEQKKCEKSNNTKLWNPDLCTCQCRDSIECSTGSFFDQNECRCVAAPANRRSANYQRRSYRSEPLSVVPLDDN